MFDIHMHIVPSVDDGSRDSAMSLKMLEMAWSEGIRGIIATPHSKAFKRPELVAERYARLRELADQLGMDMPLALGCEARFYRGITGETIDRIASGQLPTLNGTKYVLTEFIPIVDYAYVVEVIQRLRDAGFLPVIAHAERYPDVFSSLEYARQIHQSALIQINAYDLVDEEEAQIREITRALLQEQLVDFMGTDAHGTDHRPPAAAKGIEYIHAHCEAQYARAVLYENAKQLLRLGN